MVSKKSYVGPLRVHGLKIIGWFNIQGPGVKKPRTVVWSLTNYFLECKVTALWEQNSVIQGGIHFAAQWMGNILVHSMISYSECTTNHQELPSSHFVVIIEYSRSFFFVKYLVVSVQQLHAQTLGKWTWESVVYDQVFIRLMLLISKSVFHRSKEIL